MRVVCGLRCMECYQAPASDTKDGEVAAMANDRANFALLFSIVLRCLLDLDQRLTDRILCATGIRISGGLFFKRMPRRERQIQFKRHTRDATTLTRNPCGRISIASTGAADPVGFGWRR